MSEPIKADKPVPSTENHPNVEPAIANEAGSIVPAVEPVVRSIETGEPIWQNDSWAVTPLGLESRRTTEYPLAKADLIKMEDGLLSLPLQMARKAWVDIEALLEAFAQALKEHHPGRVFDLAEVAARARGISRNLKTRPRGQIDDLGHDYLEDAEARFEAYQRRTGKK